MRIDFESTTLKNPVTSLWLWCGLCSHRIRMIIKRVFIIIEHLCVNKAVVKWADFMMLKWSFCPLWFLTPVPFHFCLYGKEQPELSAKRLWFTNFSKFCYLLLVFMHRLFSDFLNFPFILPLCSALSPLTCFPWGHAECSMAECIGFCGDSHMTGPGAVSQQVILERERAAAFFIF